MIPSEALGVTTVTLMESKPRIHPVQMAEMGIPSRGGLPF